MSSGNRWPSCLGLNVLTHWDRVTHLCVSNLTIIGSDNGLSPGPRQAIISTNDVMLWIRPLGKNFSEILIEFLTFWFMKIRVDVWSAKWRPSCLGLNVLMPVLIGWWQFHPQYWFLSNATMGNTCGINGKHWNSGHLSGGINKTIIG